MSARTPLRLGIIGAGTNTTQKHLPGFQVLEDVSIEVVCNRSPASSCRVAETFGIPRIAATWQEVVADPTLDAICIGTWPYLHAPLTIAALATGKHVLTEARMAMNATEAAAMLTASHQHPGLVAQVVPSPFTLPWDRTIARLLADGTLGTLREIHFTKTMAASARADAPLSWRLDETTSGHNTMMLGIYYEPILRWTHARPARVWMGGRTFTTERTDPVTGTTRPVTIPESLTLLAESADGMLFSGHMNSVESGPGRDHFVLNGSAGTLTLDLINNELRLCPHGGPECVIEVPAAERGGWQVEADFVASIRDGRPVTHTSFATGLEYMRFTSAAYTSFHAGGQWTAV